MSLSKSTCKSNEKDLLLLFSCCVKQVNVSLISIPTVGINLNSP